MPLNDQGFSLTQFGFDLLAIAAFLVVFHQFFNLIVNVSQHEFNFVHQNGVLRTGCHLGDCMPKARLLCFLARSLLR